MEETEDPVYTMGTFLNFIFENHVLPHRCDHSSSYVISGSSVGHEFVQLLHYCPGYSQYSLIRFVIGLLHGVPESFEVFRCCSSTTEEDLKLFMKRASKHPLTYLVLEVNKLPNMLQEVLITPLSLIELNVHYLFMFVATDAAVSSGSASSRYKATATTVSLH